LTRDLAAIAFRCTRLRERTPACPLWAGEARRFP